MTQQPIEPKSLLRTMPEPTNEAETTSPARMTEEDVDAEAFVRNSLDEVHKAYIPRSDGEATTLNGIVGVVWNLKVQFVQAE